MKLLNILIVVLLSFYFINNCNADKCVTSKDCEDNTYCVSYLLNFSPVRECRMGLKEGRSCLHNISEDGLYDISAPCAEGLLCTEGFLGLYSTCLPPPNQSSNN